MSDLRDDPTPWATAHDTVEELEELRAVAAALHPSVLAAAQEAASTRLPAGWSADMDHVGSLEVRDAAGRYRGLVVLHGHHWELFEAGQRTRVANLGDAVWRLHDRLNE
jgi:Icc-related predicted phosphoesterase